MANANVTETIARLHDLDPNVVRAAKRNLGKTRDPSGVPALIDTFYLPGWHDRVDRMTHEELVNPSPASRRASSARDSIVNDSIDALAAIGQPAVAPLTKALYDDRDCVCINVIRALVRIGDVSAVSALVEMVEEYIPRCSSLGAKGQSAWRKEGVPLQMSADEALAALGKLGDVSAIPIMIKAAESRTIAYHNVALALFRIGDSSTLPRKILANPMWSAQVKARVLDSLRGVKYSTGSISLRYKFPGTMSLCRAVLDDADPLARIGAESVINWLTGEDLLRASQRDITTEAQELVRAVHGNNPETRPETLLRGANMPGEDPSHPVARLNLWQRLLHKKKRQAS